jgi:hypothetical protein
MEINIGDYVKYKKSYLTGLGFPVSEGLYSDVWEVTHINMSMYISARYVSTGCLTYLGHIDKLELVEEDTSQLSDWV